MKILKSIVSGVGLILLGMSCTPKEGSQISKETSPLQGQAQVKDDVSQKNIVQIAVGSKDHTTVVTALKAAELVDVLANPGPFTVFAPVNEAFSKLPSGTVENLLKPENKGALADLLQHHVFVGSLKESDLTDGRVLNQVDLNNIKITRKDGKIYIDEAQVLASIPASNGVVHVINGVLIPKK
jgi:uncharacterized surface protein with fasciclin (FAS1) repeats